MLCSICSDTSERQPSEDGHLLEKAFELWFSIRLTADLPCLGGDETLGMEPVSVDDGSPMAGKIPLPAVTMQQIDAALMEEVLPQLRKGVMDGFRELMCNPKSWMTVYLISFMLLHSCSMLTRKHDEARKHQSPACTALEDLRKLHTSAQVILAYYHHRSDSFNPFEHASSSSRNRNHQPDKCLTEDDKRFLERTKELLQQRAAHINMIGNDGRRGEDLYFVGQMFDDFWRRTEDAR
ncbi:hypothetical protein VTJ83DRAFT_1352 [Remersonia thermophila]|uniref:Uncharacterized protein n=1 Tax=Remersonia thermophila TaxID=72144 RepID=A0ABR4DNS3_9PEZI